MIESPLIQEVIARSKHKDIIAVLKARLGVIPSDLEAKLSAVMGEEKLRELNIRAALCPDLDAFRVHLSASPPDKDPWP
jgi:hypothetical protein